MTHSKRSRFLRLIRISLHKIRHAKINSKLIVYLFFVCVSMVMWFLNKTGSTITTSLNFRAEYVNIPEYGILLKGLTTENFDIKFTAIGGDIMHYGFSNRQTSLKVDIAKLNMRCMPDHDTSLKYVISEELRSQLAAQLPSELHITSILPDTVWLDFGRAKRKKVPVVPDLKISYAGQHRCTDSIRLIPDSIEIYGSESIIDTISAVYTQHLSLNNVQTDISQTLKLIPVSGVRYSFRETLIGINVEKFTEQTLTIGIRQINVPDSITLRIFPATARISFKIGWSNYGKVNPEMFSAYIDYNELSGAVKPDLLPVIISRVPDLGISDIRIQPEGVEYLIELNNKL